ncbi:MAG: FAD-dependent oxidoreductase [Gemmatimonadetes bacterium]|nr:FAD-dependent oxidoreductase [Gemmatimonadota bacterium]
MREGDSSPVHDVVVVGGGPAGSATAAFLAERGFDVCLIERARFPRSKPCAEYLSPEATRALDRLGVLGAIDRFGPARLRGMRIVGPSGADFVGRFVAEHGFRAFGNHGLALPRAVLDSLIAGAARARGAAVREGTLAEAIAIRDDGVEVRLRGESGPDLVLGRMLVGADGLNSRVAATLGLSRRGSRRRIALVTHAAGVTGMSEVGEMHVGRRGYVGLADVGHGITNVALVADLDRGLPAGTNRDRLFALLRAFPEVWDRARSARLTSPVRAVGPFARWTRRATAHRTLLVGDAADFYDPFTGEGIYAALRGAELAAEHIAGALARDRLTARDLAGYDRARVRTFGGKWLFERAVSGAVALPALFDRIASRLARRQGLADLMIGVAGDFVPVSRLLAPWNLLRLVI